MRCCANIRCRQTHAIDLRPVTSGHPPNRGVMIDRGERLAGIRSSFSQMESTHTADSLCRLADVQGAANMLFITRSLLAGKGRPIRFQRQGQRKRAKDAALAAQLQTRREISRIICQQCLLIQVMFGPWMLPARGPRRSQQRNPAGEEGDVLSRPICRSTGPSLVGGTTFPWPPRVGGPGDDLPGKWGPPLVCPGSGLGGLGRVLGLWWVVHSDDLQVEEGGRVGTLTRTSLDSDP